jgi:hypothetical protein
MKRPGSRSRAVMLPIRVTLVGRPWLLSCMFRGATISSEMLRLLAVAVEMVWALWARI